MTLVEVKEVDFKYYGSSFELKGLDFTLSKGERLVLYGGENSGKTTALRILCGLEEYTKGSIIIDGVELKDLSKRDMNVGFSFDSSILDSKTLVKDVISYPMRLRDMPQLQIETYLKQVEEDCNLPLTSQVKDLNNMQVALLILARLFSVDRRLYLVDDVWKDLSNDEKRVVEEYLKVVIPDKSVIIATDDRGFAREVTSGNVVVLTGKDVSPMLSLKEIKDNPLNMQSGIFAGYELHIGELVKQENRYFADIYGVKYPVRKPISDIYVGKRVCFAVNRDGKISEAQEVGDGKVMDFYYDINNERIIST